MICPCGCVGFAYCSGRASRNESTLRAYFNWAASTGVKEICFKELYVAATRESVYHDSGYNKWCRDNQVSMKLVLNFLVQNQAKQIKLPWGSPIYVLKWNGQEICTAVYTEPSVYWSVYRHMPHTGISWRMARATRA